MTSEPDYQLDIDGLQDGAEQVVHGSFVGRPWVGVRFECCAVYQRIYRNADGTAYQGQCPKCLRKVMMRIGSDGTSARFFTAE